MNPATAPLNDEGIRVVSLLRTTAKRVLTLGHAVTERRHDRPWLSLVAVPLAMTGATVSLQLWFLPALILLAWWYAPTDSVIVTLLAVLEACFGVQWAIIGATCLAAFPAHVYLVGALWAAYAGVVVVLGGINRRKFGRPYGW